MVECEAVFEDVVACLFRGECKKREILVDLRLGEAHEFELPPGVVTLLDNGLKDIKCVFMSE